MYEYVRDMSICYETTKGTMGREIDMEKKNIIECVTGKHKGLLIVRRGHQVIRGMESTVEYAWKGHHK